MSSGYPPYRGSQYPDGGDRISDLMLQRGQIEAEGAARSGQIWGNAIGGIGQAFGDFSQQYGEQQAAKAKAEKMTVQNKAIAQFVESWDGKDPKQLASGLTRIAGPDGVKLAEGILNFTRLGSQITDENREKEKASFQSTLETAARIPFPVLERWWPGMRGKVAPGAQEFLGIPPDQLPEQATPELYETIQAIVQKKPAQLTEVSPGASLFDPTKGKAVFTAPAVPEKPPNLQTVETAEGIRTFNPQTGAFGPVGARSKPRADQVPAFQSKEILDDQGRQVMANFDSRTGRYVDVAGNPIKSPRPVPTADETKDARKFKQMGPVMRAVSELSERINTLNGVIAKASGEAEKQKARINLSDDVAEYQALTVGFVPLVARALGHTGVLTQQDVDSVRQLFPTPGDSKSLRDRKVARIESIIADLESGALDSASRPALSEAVGRQPAAVKITGDDDPRYIALPVGTPYIAPDGSQRNKK